MKQMIESSTSNKNEALSLFESFSGMRSLKAWNLSHKIYIYSNIQSLPMKHKHRHQSRHWHVETDSNLSVYLVSHLDGPIITYEARTQTPVTTLTRRRW